MEFLKVWKQKFIEVNTSIKEHLSENYRKQFIIKKIVGCVLLFLFMPSMIYFLEKHFFPIAFLGAYIPYFEIGITLLWIALSWRFWHYAYWNYQGKFLDRFFSSLIIFGGIITLPLKLILCNTIILLWIALIAPITGIMTWRKAVKYEKILFINNEKNDVWA